MLPSGYRLCLPVSPGEGARVPGDLARGPEVRGSVCGDKAQEVLSLFFVIQGDQLHAFGLAEADTATPVKVVSSHSPGEEIVIALPLVVSFWFWCQCFGLSWVNCGNYRCWPRGSGCCCRTDNRGTEGIYDRRFYLEGCNPYCRNCCRWNFGCHRSFGCHRCFGCHRSFCCCHRDLCCCHWSFCCHWSSRCHNYCCRHNYGTASRSLSSLWLFGQNFDKLYILRFLLRQWVFSRVVKFPVWPKEGASKPATTWEAWGGQPARLWPGHAKPLRLDRKWTRCRRCRSCRSWPSKALLRCWPPVPKEYELSTAQGDQRGQWEEVFHPAAEIQVPPC